MACFGYKAITVDAMEEGSVKTRIVQWIDDAAFPDFRMLLQQINANTSTSHDNMIVTTILRAIATIMRSAELPPGMPNMTAYENKTVGLVKEGNSFPQFVIDYFLILRSLKASLRNLINTVKPNAAQNPIKQVPKGTYSPNK